MSTGSPWVFPLSQRSLVSASVHALFQRKILWLDLETYCAVPIKHGTYVYAESAELMLLAYAVDDGPVQVIDFTAGETLTDELLDALLEEDRLIIAHNAMFDRAVLKFAPEIPLELRAVSETADRWWCTMVQAYSHSLPGSLDLLCDIFKVPTDDAKKKTGKALVQLFCKPQPKNYRVQRATRDSHPEQWADFVAYAASDIRAMRVLARKMPTVNYSEMRHAA